MTPRENFTTKVFRKDSTLQISTISPNRKFFFRIKEPKDLYWGLFCSPIAFYEREGNLIYYNKEQHAQWGVLATKDWSIVSWSSKGNFAFFIERNTTRSVFYTLLDLEHRRFSRYEHSNVDKDTWMTELFSKLPQDKAQEVYYRIISRSSSNDVFDYVLTLDLIDDKTKLIKYLKQYYHGDSQRTLDQFRKGNFDEEIIKDSRFKAFKPAVLDKLNNGLLARIASANWRP